MSSSWLATDEERRSFRRLHTVLSLFKHYDGEMPLQQQMVFCWVALNEGKAQRDLCLALDMPNSSASRNIAALSEVHRLGKPGHGLITWYDDPADRRTKRLCLTPSGRSFAKQLLGLL